MIKSDTIVTIAKALVGAQSEMGAATKDAKNPFFKSSYADLNAIREATIPVLNKFKISVLQPTVDVEGHSFVQTILMHESGEFISSLTPIVAAKVNDAQSFGSGVSYARRYGLQSFLCVGAEDDDGEKAMGRSAKTPYVSSTPNKQYVAPTKAVDIEQPAMEKPKGGFGVKKTVVTKDIPVVNPSGESGDWN